MDQSSPVAAPPFRWRGMIEGVPRVVWAAVLTQLGLLIVWSTLLPVFDAPDEPQHIDAVLRLRAGDGWPPPGDARLSAQMLRAYDVSGFLDPETGRRSLKPVTAQQATPRKDRPSFADLGPRSPGPQINQMTQHPPLYYAVGALALAVAPRSNGLAFDQTVSLLRVVSALMLAPLPLLAYATARRLTAGSSAAIAVTAAAGPLTVPMLSHIGSAVNSDNLLTLLFGVLTVALAHAATGDTTVRTAVAVGIVASLALLTKGFALLVPVWIVLAYALAGRRTAWRPALTGLGVCLAVSLGAAGWWYVGNVLGSGALQPRVFQPPSASEEFAPSLRVWLPLFAHRMRLSFWGSFGWAEVHMAWRFAQAASAAGISGLLAAVAIRRRNDPWTRADSGVVLAPLVLLLALVAYGSWSYYTRTAELYGTQGRYLLPAIVGIAAAFALGAGRMLGRAAVLLPLLLLAAAAALQSSAAYTVLTHYYYGTEGPVPFAERLRAVLAWAPWPPSVIVTTWVLAGAAAVWTAGEMTLMASSALRAQLNRRSESRSSPSR